MPLPNLHILHPPESSLPGVTAWLGNLVGLFSTDANWDGCRVHRTEFDRQASFDVATVADLILKNPGPVVIIQSVQMRRVDHLRKMVGRKVTVHPPISASSEEDIWQVCEQVKQGYEDGDPRITLREAVAYLIVRKLCIQDKWAGCHGYLWAHDLANGGFPKDLVTSPRYVIDVAE
ncbi:MAG TPA: hypothetical protein VFO86_11620, partial [Terriglobia bacterium]|nr:hypothetical protein [Terriglobia bacterium]